MHLKAATLAIMLFISFVAQAQLILNEFSQGKSGFKEYIELVVTGTKTCTDSTADLRGWIIDDQNGWYGGRRKSISAGHFRFAPVQAWEKVPFGSIILLYNNKDKNSSITAPDDPTDANNDLVYIVPHTSSLMEVHSRPTSPSSPTFVYPTSGYVIPGVNDWQMRMSFNNLQDAVILVHPSQKGFAYFSLSYGLTIASPFQKPSISFSASVLSGQVCFLINDDAQKKENWIIGSAPSTETPGTPNTPANAAWITTLRQPPPPLPVTNTIACIAEGETYNFNGEGLTKEGDYQSIFKSQNNCDSSVHLHLSVSTTTTQSVSGCGAVLFKNKLYTSSIIITDTVISVITGCDSIYNKTSLQVKETPSIKTSADLTLCKGSATTLTASAEGASIHWLPQASGNSITVMPKQSTVYTAIAVNSAGCSDSAIINVSVQDFKLKLFATENPVVAGEETKLYTSASAPYTIEGWSPAALFINQQASLQIIKPADFTKITVVAKSNVGCTDSANLLLKVVPKGVFVPDAFTPNNDGINDVLKVTATGIKSFDFKVFNRWGNLVFKTTDATQGWTGFHNQTAQPAGVYAYTLSAILEDGQNITKRGTILLLR